MVLSISSINRKIHHFHCTFLQTWNFYCYGIYLEELSTRGTDQTNITSFLHINSMSGKKKGVSAFRKKWDHGVMKQNVVCVCLHDTLQKKTAGWRVRWCNYITFHIKKPWKAITFTFFRGAYNLSFFQWFGVSMGAMLWLPGTKFCATPSSWCFLDKVSFRCSKWQNSKESSGEFVGGGVSQICVLFIPKPGEMIQFDDHIF